MTVVGEALWERLSMDMKHAVAALAAAWQSRCAMRTEAGLPASSPEISDDKDVSTMVTGPDDSAPAPAPHVHTGFIMEQAQAEG